MSVEKGPDVLEQVSRKLLNINPSPYLPPPDEHQHQLSLGDTCRRYCSAMRAGHHMAGLDYEHCAGYVLVLMLLPGNHEPLVFF